MDIGIPTGDSVVDYSAQHARAERWRAVMCGEQVLRRRQRNKLLKALWRASQAVLAARKAVAP